MKPRLTEAIVASLSFSGETCDQVQRFEKFSQREWNRTLCWLDDAGLALYFLQKLKETSATSVVPEPILSGLEKRFTANQQRVTHMARQFEFLNARFHENGVRYAAVKGLSLVPQFCPDPYLRHQSDFDYLVDDQSLPIAQRVLVDAGYVAKPSRSSKEFIFLMPAMAEARPGDEQYEARAPYAVELHLDMWDAHEHKVPLPGPLFLLDNVSTHQWDGCAFPALPDEDAFLLQVLHACHHLFTYWIRMSWLFEIGYFLQQRVFDASLWTRIEERVGANAMLREFVVIVTELAANLFSAPIPHAVRVWGQRLRPAPRMWVDNYARQWVFGELPAYQFRLFPRAKLVLFLQQQYLGDALDRRHFAWTRLLSFSRILRMVRSIKARPSIVLKAGWWKHQRLVQRIIFHVLASFRYLCEIPRWRWLNRARVDSASLEA